MASSLLERHFFRSFAPPRRRRGGMSERSDEIQESALLSFRSLQGPHRRGARDVGA